MPKQKLNPQHSARKFVSDFESQAAKLQRLKQFSTKTHAYRALEKSVLESRRAIYGNRLARLSGHSNSFISELKRSYKEIKNYVIFSAGVAITSVFVTFFIVSISPGYGWHFLSERASEDLAQGKLWTEQIRGISSIASSEIATNNIKVSFVCFVLGIFGGIGTLIILLMNGAMLGGIFAALGRYGMSDELLEFVICHGLLELSAIAVAAGCGLYLGDAIISPGSLSRKEAISERAGPALNVILFTACALIPAGLVEGYVSPYDQYPFGVKLALGIVLCFCFWWILLAKDRIGEISQ